MPLSHLADDFQAPRVGRTVVFMVTSTTQVFDLGSSFVGTYVTFCAETYGAKLIFDSTSGIAALTSASGTNNVGVWIAPGTPQNWHIKADSRYMAVLGPSNTSYLSAYVSAPDARDR